MACAPRAGTVADLTPLGERLVREIAARGPIGVDRFMAVALVDDEHGYYTTRDPLGAGGDFTTAPEISQVFGEIVGAWLADQWQRLGNPPETALVELGPGRGTLAADVIRVLALVPACRAAIGLHLVETSPVMAAKQAATLSAAYPGIHVTWHQSLETVPRGPMLLVANEFFDALPIRQWARVDGVWQERLVGLDANGTLAFTLGPRLSADRAVELDRAAPDGEGIFETCAPAAAIASNIGELLATAPGAALIVDYGHGRSAFGDTLQAVRHHAYADPLAEPGEADLTAHVDFQPLAQALGRAGTIVYGPVSQRDFLLANGAAQRAETLLRHAKDGDAAAIRAGVDRLIAPAAMGSLFKVMTAISPPRF